MASPSGKTVDVCIIGGGLCGVLAAHRCQHAGLTYCVIERQSDLGGVWASLANQHSHLQVSGHGTRKLSSMEAQKTCIKCLSRLSRPCTGGAMHTLLAQTPWPRFQAQRCSARCGDLQKSQQCMPTHTSIALPHSSTSTSTGKIQLLGKIAAWSAIH